MSNIITAITTNNNPSVYISCVGVLVLQYVSLAFRMSMYRLKMMSVEKKGKKLTKQEEQQIDAFYDTQMLCAEWAPIIGVTLLALYAKFSSAAYAVASPVVLAGFSIQQISQMTAVVWVLTRIIFHLRPFLGKAGLLIGMWSMTACYVISFVMAGIAIFA